MYWSVVDNVTRDVQKPNPVFLLSKNGSVFTKSVFAASL